jgi:molybdopterin converting factor small subunit
VKVAIHYLAQVRRAAGRASEALDLGSGCSVQELVRYVVDRHGEALRRLLLRGEALHESILLFVGEEQVRWETPVALKEGDVVTVLAPMAGG